MSNDTESIKQGEAYRLLALFVQANEVATNICRSLRTKVGVSQVSTYRDITRNSGNFRSFGEELSFEIYLEVYMKKGRAVWWALEVSVSEKEWVLESRFAERSEHGENVLEHLPTYSVKHFDELERAAQLFLDEFSRSGNEMIMKYLGSGAPGDRQGVGGESPPR